MEDADMSQEPSVPTEARPNINIPPTRLVCLLQSMNLQWHLLVTQYPQFTLQFILGAVHSVGLDQCTMTCMDHFGIIQSSFTILNIFWILFIQPSPLTW